MVKSSEIHSYNTRNQSDYRLPGSRLKVARQSFFYKGIDLWNKIDQSFIIYKPIVKFKIDNSNFKRKVKKELISVTSHN